MLNQVNKVFEKESINGAELCRLVDCATLYLYSCLRLRSWSVNTFSDKALFGYVCRACLYLRG